MTSRLGTGKSLTFCYSVLLQRQRKVSSSLHILVKTPFRFSVLPPPPPSITPRLQEAFKGQTTTERLPFYLKGYSLLEVLAERFSLHAELVCEQLYLQLEHVLYYKHL